MATPEQMLVMELMGPQTPQWNAQRPVLPTAPVYQPPEIPAEVAARGMPAPYNPPARAAEPAPGQANLQTEGMAYRMPPKPIAYGPPNPLLAALAMRGDPRAMQEYTDQYNAHQARSQQDIELQRAAQRENLMAQAQQRQLQGRLIPAQLEHLLTQNQQIKDQPKRDMELSLYKELLQNQSETSRDKRAHEHDTATANQAQRAASMGFIRDILKQGTVPPDPKRYAGAQKVIADAIGAGTEPAKIQALARGLGFEIISDKMKGSTAGLKDFFGIGPSGSDIELKPVGNPLQQILGDNPENMPEAIKQLLGMVGGSPGAAPITAPAVGGWGKAVVK